jgi:hypothetical protein
MSSFGCPAYAHLSVVLSSKGAESKGLPPPAVRHRPLDLCHAAKCGGRSAAGHERLRSPATLAHIADPGRDLSVCIAVRQAIHRSRTAKREREMWASRLAQRSGTGGKWTVLPRFAVLSAGPRMQPGRSPVFDNADFSAEVEGEAEKRHSDSEVSAMRHSSGSGSALRRAPGGQAPFTSKC